MKTPIENENSDCYGCTAGMCDICSSNSEWDRFNYQDYDDINEDYKEEKTKEKINIIECYMCGWKHHNPKDWQKYEVAPNGSLQKTCGGCGRMSLIEKQVEK